MKKVIYISIIGIIIILAASLLSPNYLVVRVIDGDTVELNNGEIVRYISVDTPELGKPLSIRAKSRNEELVLDREVELIKTDRNRDVYGRLLRDLVVNNQNISKILIKEGLGKPYNQRLDK